SAKRFAREAELAAAVRHPNLVGIVDVGLTDAGVLFFVMELARGTTLEDARGRYGDATFWLPVLADVARGLAALHAQRVVHRDVKPANILLAEADDGTLTAKLADLGVARRDEEPMEMASTLPAASGPVSSARPADLTVTGAWVGTPLYMAPETARG